MKRVLWTVAGLAISTVFIGLVNNATKPEIQGTQTQAVPTVAAQITQAALPTDIPTLIPTKIPTPIPTVYVFPTATPTVYLPPTAAVQTVPNGASAICADGTYSYSAHIQVTCSHHGGADSWLKNCSA